MRTSRSLHLGFLFLFFWFPVKYFLFPEFFLIPEQEAIYERGSSSSRPNSDERSGCSGEWQRNGRDIDAPSLSKSSSMHFVFTALSQILGRRLSAFVVIVVVVSPVSHTHTRTNLLLKLRTYCATLLPPVIAVGNCRRCCVRRAFSCPFLCSCCLWICKLLCV